MIKDFLEFLHIIQTTDIPTLLVVAGLLLVLLAIIRKIGVLIELTTNKQRLLAGVSGVVLLAAGLALLKVPSDSGDMVTVTPAAASPIPEPIGSGITPSPTFTLTPTHSPSPTSASVWSIDLADGSRVAQTITLIGDSPADLSVDIWIFVVPPNGLYYPQSANACEGTHTPRVDGKWEMRLRLGDPGNIDAFYTIVVTVADTQTSQLVVDTLKQWCNIGNYFGWKDLPTGIEEKLRVTVVRAADLWAPAPLVSNAQLPGKAFITNVAEGDQVPESMTVMGTYETTDEIWVLVHAPNGRWYPQSNNACTGLHALKVSGQWQVQASFGGKANEGEPFDIAVIAASRDANAFFDAKQREWCEAGDYPGLLTIELPQGIDEKSRVRVYRR